tara:strand:+ start:218 stop:496 length:279 start_codon:yes stop_codon:yes gene_type:complete
MAITKKIYEYFCLIGFDTPVEDTSCIIRRDTETNSLEFCNPYRGWTENSDLRRRFLGGDNALEKIDQAFASKKVAEWLGSWVYPGTAEDGFI